jgi:hypothetical protein
MILWGAAAPMATSMNVLLDGILLILLVKVSLYARDNESDLARRNMNWNGTILCRRVVLEVVTTTTHADDSSKTHKVDRGFYAFW